MVDRSATVGDPVPLPVSFWFETAMLAASGVVLWLAVAAIKREQNRRHDHIRQERALLPGRRTARRYAP